MMNSPDTALRGNVVGHQLHAQSRALDRSVLDELGHHTPYGFDRHREPDPHAGARGAMDGGVHADEAATTVEQRTARVARIDRGVGLDHIVDGGARNGADLAPERADDTGGQRVVETERIADGNDLLTDPQRAGIAHRQRRSAQIVFDAQDGPGRGCCPRPPAARRSSNRRRRSRGSWCPRR